MNIDRECKQRKKTFGIVNVINYELVNRKQQVKTFPLRNPCGLLGIMLVVGLAVGMEFKDKMYGGKFDFLDILATLLGGMIGFVLMLVIVISTGAIDWYINILIKLSELL